MPADLARSSPHQLLSRLGNPFYVSAAVQLLKRRAENEHAANDQHSSHHALGWRERAVEGGA